MKLDARRKSLLFLVALALFSGCASQPVRPVAVRRIDGDTIEMPYRPPVPILERVRLLEINTPEKGQPGYQEATAALVQLTSRKAIALEFEGSKPERDRHGHLLCYVIADGLNVNVEMVRPGWSFYYTKYGYGKYRERFEKAEAETKQNRRGLWALGIR